MIRDRDKESRGIVWYLHSIAGTNDTEYTCFFDDWKFRWLN